MTHTLPIYNSDKVTLVDEDTYIKYMNTKFHFRNKQADYVSTSINGTSTYLHRLILPSSTLRVDHVNGNVLDNRICNLRLCTVSQNASNRGKTKFNTSGFKGVSKQNGKWACHIKVRGKVYTSYGHTTALEAAYEYNRFGREHVGEFFQGNDI